MSCHSTDELVAGTSVKLSASLSIAGAPADAASVILRAKDPVGTVTTPPVSHDGTGRYSSQLAVSRAGQWWFRWEATAPLSVQEGSFDVRASRVA